MFEVDAEVALVAFRDFGYAIDLVGFRPGDQLDLQDLAGEGARQL